MQRVRYQCKHCCGAYNLRAQSIREKPVQQQVQEDDGEEDDIFEFEVHTNSKAKGQSKAKG